jgi:hypothetical protein
MFEYSVSKNMKKKDTVPQGQLRHKIVQKIDAEDFGILLVFFAKYNINYFSKLPKS